MSDLLTDPSVVQLLEYARQKKSISYEEINDRLPDELINSDRIDEVAALLEQNDVTLEDDDAGDDVTEDDLRQAGDHGIVHDAVVRRMRSVLEEKQEPRYLDRGAAELLREGRDTYRRLGLARRRVVEIGAGRHLVATWDGTIRTMTFALALRCHGFAVVDYDGFLDVKDREPERDRLARVLRTLAVEPAPDGAGLASGMSALESEKYHRYLSRELLILDAVSSKMSPGSVPGMARRLLTNGVTTMGDGHAAFHNPLPG